jgi:hypothetical protein
MTRKLHDEVRRLMAGSLRGRPIPPKRAREPQAEAIAEQAQA